MKHLTCGYLALSILLPGSCPTSGGEQRKQESFTVKATPLKVVATVKRRASWIFTFKVIDAQASRIRETEVTFEVFGGDRRDRRAEHLLAVLKPKFDKSRTANVNWEGPPFQLTLREVPDSAGSNRNGRFEFEEALIRIEKSDNSQNDTAGFQYDGIWKPKGAMLRGVLLPPAALEAITLKIKNGRYEVTVKGEDHSDTGTFTVDETTSPKRMTIESQSGPNKGKTFLAIFETKNANAMRVCYDLSGKQFPQVFKAPKDTDLYLVGYRRQTSEAQDSAKAPSQTKGEPVPDSDAR